MKVLITGGTGFIGRALVKVLMAHGIEPIVVSRNANHAKAQFDTMGFDIHTVEWDAKTGHGWAAAADQADVIINLAGENLAGVWTETKKRHILQSRLNAASAVVDALRQCTHGPKTIIQASAMGYYGHSPDQAYTEDSPAGQGFLADVCRQWEDSIMPAVQLGARVAVIRTGIVLGPDGGLLPPIASAFKHYAGGCIGTGRQWFSWISLDDQVDAIRFLINNPNCSGPYNLTSPEPATMGQFCDSLSQVLDKPNWLKLPAFVVRIAAADIADELLITGRKVLPKRLLDSGYHFSDIDLKDTLETMLLQKANI